jgi:hypothetical protein
MGLTQHMNAGRSRKPRAMLRDLSQGARTSCFSFSMSLSTRCEPMKPAPPVTRIRRLAWIKQQFGTDNQDPGHASRPRPHGEGGDPATGSRAHLEELGEAERRGGRRRAGGGVLAVAAIGLLLRHRVAHLVPPRSNPNHTRQASGKNHAPERDGTKRRSRNCERASNEEAWGGREGDGARRSPSSWRRGLGSACLAPRTDTGNGRFESD